MKTAEQVARAYELLDFLETHPEQHDQSMWVNETGETPFTLTYALNHCGTTACAAGWTVLLNGGTIQWYDNVTDLGSAPVGSRQVPAVAKRLLGLTHAEKSALFYDAGDLADVRKQIGVIFGPRPDGVGPYGVADWQVGV